MKIAIRHYRRQARYVETLGLPGAEWIEERGAFFIRSCFG